jgi:hypothetical protein
LILESFLFYFKSYYLGNIETYVISFGLSDFAMAKDCFISLFAAAINAHFSLFSLFVIRSESARQALSYLKPPYKMFRSFLSIPLLILVRPLAMLPESPIVVISYKPT